MDPVSSSKIELFIIEIGGEESLYTILPPTARSFILPSDFIKNNAHYFLELWFVSNDYPNGYKYSVSMITTLVGDLDRDGDVDGIDLAIYKDDQSNIGLRDFAQNFGEPIPF